MNPLHPASEEAHRPGGYARAVINRPRTAPKIPSAAKASGRRHQGGRHHPAAATAATASRSSTSGPAHRGRAISPTAGATERFPRPETLTSRPGCPLSPQRWACLPVGQLPPNLPPAVQRSPVLNSKHASDLEPPYGIEP